MNKGQREQLADVVEKLRETIGALETLKDTVEDVRSEEAEKFDNLTEGLQATERGQKMEAGAEALEQAVDTLETILSELDDAITAIEEATE